MPSRDLTDVTLVSENNDGPDDHDECDDPDDDHDDCDEENGNGDESQYSQR